MNTEPGPLIQRLRGIYTVQVNDGAGPIDGKTTHTRKFEVAPICLEAAARIEQLEAVLLKIQTHEGWDENNCHMKPYEIVCEMQRWAEEVITP